MSERRRHPGTAGPHVLVLARALAFPKGYAASSRVRLLGRALVQQGASVRVLSTAVSERAPVVENKAAKGSWEGIDFEYTTGTPVRSRRFLVRRIVEARGVAVGAARVIALRRAGRVDCVYLWWTSQRRTVSRALVLGGLRALGVPVVIEMNEPPWPLRPGADGHAGRASPIDGVDGVIAISRLLADWTRNEARRRGESVDLIEVPIVVDVDEQHVVDYPFGDPRVVYAASPGWDQALRFIYGAMDVVWRRNPHCRLVVTGVNPGDPASRPFLDAVSSGQYSGNVEVPGHLPRERLLAEYSRAHALLIPLFDDVRSRARFPTKIGEYLASGRPVVTTSVGEIERFFSHGVNGFLSPPGDALAFGENVCRVLDDRARAAAIGLAGRELAEHEFDYQAHGPRLLEFFTTVSKRKSGQADRRRVKEPGPVSGVGRRERGG